MRPEDWQRWLDAQFLDREPSHETAAPAQPAAREAVEQPQHALAEPALNPSRTAADLHPARPPADVEIPAFEDYIPAFRRQPSGETPPRSDGAAVAPHAPEAAPIAETAAPTPAAPEVSHEPPATDLDRPEAVEAAEVPSVSAESPSPADAGPSSDTHASAEAALHSIGSAGSPAASAEPSSPSVMRPRSAVRARQTRVAEKATTSGPALTASELWNLVPRHIQTLIAMGTDEGVQRNYKRAFKESRIELISRLLDPTLSLEDTARLLKVCPTTVRRYTNKGLLRHQRTSGDQRRFKLSDVLAFLEAQSTSREP